MSSSNKSDLNKLGWLQALIGWLALVFVLFSALALGANRPVSWIILSFLTIGLFAFQLFRDHLVSYSNRITTQGLVILLYLAVILWAIFQVVGNMPEALRHASWARVEEGLNTISADPAQGHHAIMRLITYGMLFWIGFRATQNAARAHRFVQAIAVFSTALAIFGIYALFSGSNPILDTEGSRTVNASFVNRNSYATYAVFGFLANITAYLNHTGDIRDANGIWQRLRNGLEAFFAGSWVFALGALICFTAVALTQSRAGAGAGLIAVLTFFLAYRLKGRGSSRILLIMLAVIFGFVVFTSTSGLTERLLTTTDEDGRFAIYPRVIEGIWERPWLGHGLGAFHETFRALVPIEAATGEWHLAHNTYLENIYELGIPATSALYLALILIITQIWRGTRIRQRDRAYSCFALASALAAGFHSVFDFSLQMPATASLFAMILGLGLAQSVSSRNRKKRTSSQK